MAEKRSQLGEVSKSREVDAHEMLCFTTETMRLKSKMERKRLCFTIATAVGGREGRRCPAVAVMCGYARPCSLMVGSVGHGEVQLQIARRLVMAGSRWRWVADGGAVLWGNAIADF